MPKNIAISAAIVSSALLFSTAALAARPENAGSTQNTAHQPYARPSLPSHQVKAGSEGAKLKACQARENAIKTRSAKLTRLATTLQEKFDAIAKRVKDYYTNKVVPSGKTVSSYDVLVADIDAKKAAIQTVLTKTRTDLASFSCNGSDPKSHMMTFREDMQGVKQELKDYRTSIKNLIVAVHSVTGRENRDRDNQASGSAKPSHSPDQEGNQP